jgi:WD40 repeat protein
VSASVAVASVGAGAYVVNQNRLLDEQRNAALISQSRFLSGMALEQLELGDPMLASLLALEALPQDVESPDRPLVDEAINALRMANLSLHQENYSLLGTVPSGDVSKFAYLEGDDILLLMKSGGTELYNGRNGAYIGTIESTPLWNPAYSDETSRLAVAISGSSPALRIYELGDMSSFDIPLPDDIPASGSLEFLHGGNRLLVSRAGSDGDFLSIYDIASREVIWRGLPEDFFADALLRERETPETLAFGGSTLSPDGELLAYSAHRSLIQAMPEDTAPVRLMDTATAGTVLQSGTPGTVYTNLVFSPDGSQLCMTQGEDMLEIWDAKTGGYLFTLGEGYTHPEGFCADRLYSPDSLYLAVRTYDDKAFVYDAKTGEVVTEASPDRRVTAIDFTGEHTLVFRDGADSPTILFYEIGSPNTTTLTVPGGLHTDYMALPDYNLYSPVFQAEKNILVAYSGQGRYQIWSDRTEDTASLASEGDGKASPSDTRSFLPLTVSEGFIAEGYTAKAFSHAGDRAALSIGGYICIFDTQTGALLLSLGPDEYRAQELFWSPDDTQLLHSSMGAGVYLWDTQSGELLAQIPRKFDATLASNWILSVSPTWEYLILNSSSDQLEEGLYRLPSLAFISDLKHLLPPDSPDWLPAVSSPVQAAFLADGKRFYLPLYGRFALVGEEGAELLAEHGEYAVSNRIAVSPDGSKVAAFSTDPNEQTGIVVLEAETGTELWRQPAHEEIYGKPIVWSPDSRYVATSHSRKAETKVWDGETGGLIGTFAFDTPSFSYNGRLISGEVINRADTHVHWLGDGKGVVYETETGRLIANLPQWGIFSPVREQVLMPAGLWAFYYSLPEEMAEATARLEGRTLTEEEQRRFYLQ